MAEMLKHKMIHIKNGNVSFSLHDHKEIPYLISVDKDGVGITLHLSNEDMETFVVGLKKFYYLKE